MRRLALAAALPILAVLGGCVDMPAPPGSVYVDVAPPPMRVEVAGIAPSPHHIWVGGNWTYGGRNYYRGGYTRGADVYRGYRWTPGRWESRPHARARWVDGRWISHRGRYYWRNGYWR